MSKTPEPEAEDPKKSEPQPAKPVPAAPKTDAIPDHPSKRRMFTPDPAPEPEPPESPKKKAATK